MDFMWIAVGIAALFILNKLILAPFRKLIVNVAVGLFALYLINSYGYMLGLEAVPITIVTGIIIGILGLPGVVLVTLYYTMF